MNPLAAAIALLILLGLAAPILVREPPDESMKPGVAGSKHDFSHKEWTAGDLCAACHSPHRHIPPAAAPLWDPNADLTRTFGTPLGESPTPGAGTRVCIRCHDGTVARDTLTGVVGERFVSRRHPGRFETGHGRTDHPVGVPYPQFDRGYRPLTSVLASGTVRLPDGKVECVSCHDPHNQAGVEYMLVGSNVRSALCLTCHRK